MASVKTALKSQFARIIGSRYEKRVKEKVVDFDTWISEKEKNLPKINMSIGTKIKRLESERRESVYSMQPVSFENMEANDKPKKEIMVKGLPSGIEIDELSFMKALKNVEPIASEDEEETVFEEVVEEELNDDPEEELLVDPEEYVHKSFVTRVGATTFRIVPFEAISRDFSVNMFIEDIIVFANGELTPWALPLIAETFNKYPKTVIVYGDEDIADLSDDEARLYGEPVKGSRRNPYFKPDWSPNAFLHHFYFCNIVAVKRHNFRDVVFGDGFKNTQSGTKYLYHTLLRFVTANENNILSSVRHVDEILIHATNYDNNDIKDASSGRFARNIKKTVYNKKVTVVIPSKDSPQMLEDCIKSIKATKRAGIDIEIVVVDNGSCDSNRAFIEGMREKYGFRYEYIKSEFNFSNMCNYGASFANGDFILFLNDDVMLMEPGTINSMVSEAEYRFTGAVGIKLLYPNSSTIQHAGVINNRIGPVHKLQYMDDKKVYYNGFNRYAQNVLAVTAACLMIRKDLFESCGGFDESLRVAFNDVELCYKLHEAGYKNVCLNNIIAVHRESVSRGADTDSKSLRRLMSERRKLYDIHPALKAKDPFYGKYNVNDCLDTRIVSGNVYEFKKNVSLAGKYRQWDLQNAREDACLKISVEFAGKLEDYTFGQYKEFGRGHYIQGFSFVVGSDNAFYTQELLLKSENAVYRISYDPCYRDDVAANCPDQKHVEMSGFSVLLNDGELPAGTYLIGALVTKRFSKEKIYYFSNKEIVL